MKLLKWTVVFLVFLAVLTSLFYTYQKRSDQKTSPITEKKITKQVTQPKFIWGGTFGAVFDWYPKEIGQQMSLLQEHNINAIRWIYTPKIVADWALDELIFKAAADHDIEVVLILEPKYPDANNIKFTEKNIDYRKMGNDLATEAIGRFGEEVDYYQLINEIGGTALKGGDGQQKDMYDVVKYTNLKETIIGMNQAIKKLDPTAKTVVTNQWLHYGILDLLARDKIDYDIIGWNWFPEDIDMDKVEYAPGKTINLIQKLQTYKKPLWLAEFNRDHGSFGPNGERAQAKFLQDKLPKYYNTGAFSAIFIHTLFDNERGDDKDRQWGLFRVVSPNSATPKPAAKIYSDFITKHSK